MGLISACVCFSSLEGITQVAQEPVSNGADPIMGIKVQEE